MKLKIRRPVILPQKGRDVTEIKEKYLSLRVSRDLIDFLEKYEIMMS